MILVMASLIAVAEAPVVVSSLQTPHFAEECKGKDTDPTANFCTGYILGAFDTLSLSHQICPSAKGAFTLDAVAATRKYIRTHQDAWSRAPTFVVRSALQAAYPCKRK